MSQSNSSTDLRNFGEQELENGKRLCLDRLKRLGKICTGQLHFDSRKDTGKKNLWNNQFLSREKEVNKVNETSFVKYNYDKTS